MWSDIINRANGDKNGHLFFENLLKGANVTGKKILHASYLKKINEIMWSDIINRSGDKNGQFFWKFSKRLKSYEIYLKKKKMKYDSINWQIIAKNGWNSMKHTAYSI